MQPVIRVYNACEKKLTEMHHNLEMSACDPL